MDVSCEDNFVSKDRRTFKSVIPAQNFAQSRTTDGYLWHLTSRVYSQPRISPRFCFSLCFKIPNLELQTRENQDPAINLLGTLPWSYQIFFVHWSTLCMRLLNLNRTYSYFEKGCRKKCTRQSRKALWVVLSSLFFKEIWKNWHERPWKCVCEC